MTFTTATGDYNLIVDDAAIQRVHDLLGIDLNGDGAQLANRFAAEPATFVDVIYAIIKPQADARGIDDLAWGRGLTLAGHAQASGGFFTAWAERPGLRKNSRTLLKAAAIKASEISNGEHPHE